MKVSRIEIKDFQQFKDFTLDLTYPQGHTLAGQPLKKVCIIGQSGTGKTTILNVIGDLIEGRNKKYPNNYDESFSYRMDYCILNLANKGLIYKHSDDISKNTTYYGEEFFSWHDKEFDNLSVDRRYVKGSAIFFQTNLENLSNSIIGSLSQEKPLIHTQADENNILKSLNTIFFEYTIKPIIKSKQDFNSEEFRLFLLKDLDKYDRLLKDRLNEFVSKAFNSNVEKVLADMRQWKLDNPNPRIKIGQKLKPIFEKFNLKIDEEWADGGLKLKTLQDQEILINVASTGTKQILLSVIPLIFLETAHKVILMDEPENSLYPDIQRTLIQYYTDLAPEAQFFFATHSPLIASQFEPWEVVELEFNKETGFVQRKKYYEGENNVNNYTIYPQYLRWDDILTKVFDVSYEGNADFREELLAKTLRLKKQIVKMEKEKQQETKEYQDKIGEYIKNAKKLGWTEEIRATT